MPAGTYTDLLSQGKWLLAKVRVYIVDEHEPVRLALADRLNDAAEIRVLGHSGHADEALTEIRRTAPDVVLIEVKRSDAPRLTPSMRIAMEDLGLDHLAVVHQRLIQRCYESYHLDLHKL